MCSLDTGITLVNQSIVGYERERERGRERATIENRITSRYDFERKRDKELLPWRINEAMIRGINSRQDVR